MENINAGIIDMQLTGLLQKHPEWFMPYCDEERKRAAAFVFLCMANSLDISKEDASKLLADGGNDAGGGAAFTSVSSMRMSSR